MALLQPVALPDARVLEIAATDAEPSVAASPCILLSSAAIALVEAPSHYHGCSGGDNTTFFAICADRSLYVYDLPKAGSGGALVESAYDYPAHDKEPTSLALSADGAFLATAAMDGVLSVRSVNALDDPVTVALHDSFLGGITSLLLLPDTSPAVSEGAALAYTCGKDGVMYMTTVNPIAEPDCSPAAMPAPLPLTLPTLVEGLSPEEAVNGAVAIPPVSDDATDITLLEAAEVAAKSGAVQSDARDALAAKVDALRVELQELREANAALEDDDLEKLAPTDFIIDLPQQQEWRDEGTAQVEALKAKIEEANLVDEIVRERMEEEFWNAMEAPAITVHALKVPGASDMSTRAKCNSYTVPKMKSMATDMLNKVKLLRRTEVIIDKWEASNSDEPDVGAANSFEAPGSVASDIARVVTAAEAKAAAAAATEGDGDGAKAKDSGEQKDGDGDGDGDEAAAEEASTSGDPKATGYKLLYPPFALHTPWRKVSQITIHGEVQRELKKDFNGQMADLLSFKRAELERIKEKQVRIKEIEDELQRLKAQGDGEETEEMAMHDDEEPEKILQVADSEISAAKFISPAEKERLAKLQAEREAREAAEAGDTLGKRGLRNMMNGTLETRREEDAIFTEIPQPEFFVDGVPPEAMSDEEKAALKDYEDKVKKLGAEREKRSKGLLTELSKLREDIREICTGFNDRVVGLKETKMAFDGAIYESELLVIRLAQARLAQETFVQKTKDLEDELNSLSGALGEASKKVAGFKSTLSTQSELVENLSAEDKALDKAFRRDFADVPDFLEALKKLYNRRKTKAVPLGTRAAQKAAQASGADPSDLATAAPRRQNTGRAGAAMLVAVQSSSANNVMAQADEADDQEPGAAGRDPFTSLDAPETEQMVEALDAAVDMPEGLSFDVWDRLVEARNAKIDSEEELKLASAILSQMTEYNNLLVGEDERLRTRIDELRAELDERRKRQIADVWDLELPFKLKQGQVEVQEAAVVTDYSNAVLIHRSEVVELNKEIRRLGGEKVDILKEIRDFRKGIVMLQWESTKADMEADDLVERTKEFQLLRVTKDLQSKIRGGGEENHAVEVAALEKKLEQLKASHEEKVADLRRQVAKINALIVDKRSEMESLQGQIEQLEGSVLEREMIHEIHSKNANASGDSYRRFEELHMKRKLQTLVGMQTQEIGLLREELDRLRRRTFPTFTHIDHRAATDAL